MAKPNGRSGGKGRGGRITERSVRILRFVARHGVVTVHHVRSYAFGSGGGENGLGPASVEAVYREMRKLKAKGLIRHDRVLHNEPGVYRLTEAGARAAGLDLAPARIDLADLEHDLWVVTLSLLILRSAPYAARWITEREIRHAVLGRSRAARTGLIREGHGFGRIPDGLLVGIGGERVAIEVERSSKRLPVLRRIMSSYAAKHRTEIPSGLPHHCRDPRAHLEHYVASNGELDGVAYYAESPEVRRRVRTSQEQAATEYRGRGMPTFWALDLRHPDPPALRKYAEQERARQEVKDAERRAQEESRAAEVRRVAHESLLRRAKERLTERELKKALRGANRRAGRPLDAFVPREEADRAILAAAEQKREKEGARGVGERLRNLIDG